MSEEYGGDIVTITDEEGREYVLEHLDTIEYNDNIYMAFIPADLPEDDPDYGMVLLRAEQDGEFGEWLFSALEDDEEAEVYEVFMKRLFDDPDEEEEKD